MLNTNQWTKFGIESVLIVLSILAAFGVDSWWAERQQSIELRHTLLQLREEFAANAKMLADRRDRQMNIIKAAQELLAVTGPGASSDSLDIARFNKLVFTVFDWYTFDPETAVLGGLVQSGKLGMIDSEDLRYALASWPAALGDLLEDESVARDYSTGPMAAYLVEHAPSRNIERAGLLDREDYPEIGESKFPGDMQAVLSDRVFENLVHHKLWLSLDILGEYKLRGMLLDEISALIDRQILSSEY